MGVQGTRAAFPSCCGATIFHGLRLEGEVPTMANNAKAMFAVTNPAMRPIADQLKADGFIKVLTWTGLHGDELILWARGETVKKFIIPKKSKGATSPSTTRGRRKPPA